MTVDRLDRIEATLEIILTEVRGTNERLDGLEARVGKLEARFEALEARFEALEARFEALEARFDTLEARFDTLENRVDQLARDTGQMWREIVARIDAKADELKREILSLKSELRSDIHEARRVSSSDLDFATKSVNAKIEMLDFRLTAIERHVTPQPAA